MKQCKREMPPKKWDGSCKCGSSEMGRGWFAIVANLALTYQSAQHSLLFIPDIWELARNFNRSVM